MKHKLARSRVAVVLLLLFVSCADGEREQPLNAGEAEADSSVEGGATDGVSAFKFLEDFASSGLVATTGDFVLRALPLPAPADSDGGRGALSDHGVLLFSASMQIGERIAYPQVDGGFLPLAVAAAEDRFAIVGFVCDLEARQSDDNACTSSEPVSFALDTETKSWSTLRFAPELAELNVSSVSNVGSIRGEPVATITTFAPGSDTGRYAVRLEGDEWQIDGKLPADASSVCRTSDFVFVLQKSIPSVNGDATVDATLELQRFKPGSETSEIVDLPPLNTSYGGAGVAMACDRDHVFLTSADAAPAGENAATVYRLDAAQWSQVDALVPDGALPPPRLHSTEKGVIAEWGLSDEAASSPGARAFVSANGLQRSALIEAPEDVQVVVGVDGTVVLIPLPADPIRVEENGGEAPSREHTRVEKVEMFT